MIGHIHGFIASEWINAQAVAREILVGRAKRRTSQLITYTQLVGMIPLAIEPHDYRLSFFLDEISRKEHQEGRGFLTVLVVHAQGSSNPGAGFYAMARECGEQFDDETEFFIRALNKVIGFWGAPENANVA